MDKRKKITIINKLLEDGYFSTMKEAVGWIMMGKVYAGNELITTCGCKIYDDSVIRIKDFDKKYVSKGGLKLEGAISDLRVDVKDKVAFDAGASTGGFTDCLLQHGAKKVYAVEVGFGQLSGKLRQDARVVNMEKTNISDDILLSLDEKPEIASLDLSYLSLKKGIPACAEIMDHKGIIMCLVKPLFEISSTELRRTGVITDESTYEEVLLDLVDYINNTAGFSVFGISNSHVRGNKGTVEFFLGVSLDNKEAMLSEYDAKTQAQQAVQNALQLEEYK